MFRALSMLGGEGITVTAGIGTSPAEELTHPACGVGRKQRTSHFSLINKLADSKNEL